jgi:hypothetical protein
MPVAENAARRIARTYAVLVGMTPLIPVPFVDDMARGYFRRRMVRALASSRREVIADADVRLLADTVGAGCLSGCLLAPFLYLLKRIFRKIFLFLEWKRAVDVASEAYHFGSLIDHVFERRWLTTYDAARIRAAIDAVLSRRGTSPIDRAVREAFERSKGAVVAAARGMRSALGGLTRRARPEQVDAALQSAERLESERVDGVAGALEDALAGVPATYMEELLRQVEKELRAQQG